MESYKGPLTRSKSKKLVTQEVGQSSRSETSEILIMGDREEQRNEIPNEERERNNRQRNPRRRARSNPLNLHGEQHTFPTLPQGVLPVFSGDGIMDPKRHMDQFLSVCDIHLIEHDDVMVRVFLQTLIGPTYEWYLSLPTQSIGSFDDLESMFMTMYAPPIAYHTLLTQFTQIHLKKGERIRDFNL
jgi:hypothetical protein